MKVRTARGVAASTMVGWNIAASSSLDHHVRTHTRRRFSGEFVASAVRLVLDDQIRLKNHFDATRFLCLGCGLSGRSDLSRRSALTVRMYPYSAAVKNSMMRCMASSTFVIAFEIVCCDMTESNSFPAAGKSAWDEAAVRVWPAAREAVPWPPPVALQDTGEASLDGFCDRWGGIEG